MLGAQPPILDDTYGYYMQICLVDLPEADGVEGDADAGGVGAVAGSDVASGLRLANPRN